MMANQFIDPNWHPLLVHYPIAFLSMGITIELLSFLWPRGLFRAAGRWMILLGALLAAPTAMAGIYALRVAAAPSSAQPRLIPWRTVVQQSHWSNLQWNYMSWHVLLNSIAAGVALGAVTAWVGASDRWRRKLHIPLLLLLMAVMGMIGVGAWFSGESIYQYGTAVEAAPASASSSVHQVQGIQWYIPPLELHIVLAGFAVAVIAGAMGLTIRRLEPRAEQTEPGELIGQPPESDVAVAPPPAPRQPVESSGVIVLRDVFAGRFWLLGLFAVLCTAVAGIWSVVDVFTAQAFAQNGHDLGEHSHFRLLLHVIFAAVLAALLILLAVVARWGRRWRRLTGGILALLVLVTAFQIWLGIAMLYDSHQGPIFGFNSAGAAEARQHAGHSH